MLLEYVQDLGHDLPMVFDCGSVYQDIVCIDHHISFINEVLEDVIHHGLEGGWAVGEAKEHDQVFEEAPIRLEGGVSSTSVLCEILVLRSGTCLSQCQ